MFFDEFRQSKCVALDVGPFTLHLDSLAVEPSLRQRCTCSRIADGCSGVITGQSGAGYRLGGLDQKPVADMVGMTQVWVCLQIPSGTLT